MRILITGAGGMLGLDIDRAARNAGDQAVSLSRAELDVTDATAVGAALRRIEPDVVINCAAYTNVDRAETDSEAAFAVNGVGAGVVAAAAASSGAWVVHLSTDYVFDGSKREPYVESDETGAASVYGASKLAGEQAVAQAAPESHTIVRSSWLFGTGGPCFPATMLRVAAERDELTVVDDQRGCPTFTGHLARALLAVAAAPGVAVLGVVHIAAEGDCTWFEFATEILRSAGSATTVTPGTTAALARPAPRPAYSVLRTERGDAVPRLPDWREGLREYMSERVEVR
jgi:dTDP-4-dehydrorhamnose reductase